MIFVIAEWSDPRQNTERRRERYHEFVEWQAEHSELNSESGSDTYTNYTSLADRMSFFPAISVVTDPYSYQV